MAQKTFIPKISDCVAPAPRPVSLSDRRILQAIGAFLVLALLLVCHIYLRFTIRDLKVQHQRMQVSAQKLQQETRDLQCEIARLRDTARLREYAKFQMGMKETDPRTQEVAMVSEALKAKYEVKASALARPNALSPADASQSGGTVAQLLLTLVDANKAFAASEKD